MKRFEENKTVKSTGLASTPERQTHISQSVESTMELHPALQGCLAEVDGKSDLRLMLVQAQDASWRQFVSCAQCGAKESYATGSIDKVIRIAWGR